VTGQRSDDGEVRDLDPGDDEPRAEGPRAATPEPSRAPAVPVFPVPTSRRSGRRRWATVGCVAGLLLVAGALVVSFSTIKSGMYQLVDRASARVEHRLPFDLPAGERERTVRNLRRLRSTLGTLPDRDVVMGGFLSRVAAALEDDRLAADEVADLNAYLESVLPGGAGPEAE
jgi:hypothetical protein